MGQFQKIINFFNSLTKETIFTSSQMSEALKEYGVTSKNVGNFLDSAKKMEVVCRSPIKNPGRGPRFEYMKERSITGEEMAKLTTAPDCYEFKRQLNLKWKKKMAKKKKDAVIVKATDDSKIKIAESKSKTVITIFK